MGSIELDCVFWPITFEQMGGGRKIEIGRDAA